MTYGVLVNVISPFPISVYYPLAALSAPAYPLPPPTTLVGALAYPYHIRHRRRNESGPESPAAELLKSGKVLYASAGAEGYIQTKQVERVFQAPYLEEKYRKEPETLFSVGARGGVNYANDALHLFYVVKDRELADLAWGITRIGRKEGLVAVGDVIMEEMRCREERSAVTLFYTPKRLAVCDGGAVSMPKLIPENFSERPSPEVEEFWIPQSVGAMSCALLRDARLAEMGGFKIIVPREVC
ncbi:MAG: type I-A CRISPR-associated protein Cas5 [Thermoproteus sp.]|nr:type I-A CRISPR-associated protein Cas5 [Thermoproteus sp.]